RLTMIQLTGLLSRWVKTRVTEATNNQLLTTEWEMMARARESQEGRASIAKVMTAQRNHPLYKLLFKERVRREILLQDTSTNYLDSLSSLTENEIQSYLIWKGDKHGSVDDWKKDRRRTLKVMNEVKENNRRLSNSGEASLPRDSDRQSNI